eukprot:844632_1
MPIGRRSKQKRRLTQEEVDEYREAFSLFDKDGDGSISADELGIVVRTIGMNPTELEVQDMMKELDKNKDGVIEFDEFLDMMSQMDDPDPNEIRKMFRKFDTDGSGGLSLQELRHGIKSLGVGVTDEELDEMLRDADTNRDGEISHDEFMRMMMEG